MPGMVPWNSCLPSRGLASLPSIMDEFTIHGGNRLPYATEPLPVFSLLIPTGDGEQQTMVIWMERRGGRRERLWEEGRDEGDNFKE